MKLSELKSGRVKENLGGARRAVAGRFADEGHVTLRGEGRAHVGTGNSMVGHGLRPHRMDEQPAASVINRDRGNLLGRICAQVQRRKHSLPVQKAETLGSVEADVGKILANGVEHQIGGSERLVGVAS